MYIFLNHDGTWGVLRKIVNHCFVCFILSLTRSMTTATPEGSACLLMSLLVFDAYFFKCYPHLERFMLCHLTQPSTGSCNKEQTVLSFIPPRTHLRGFTL